MKDQNLLEKVLNVLQEKSFIFKGRKWIRKNQETVSIINLQKSQYGNQYYLNVGVCLIQDRQDTDVSWRTCELIGRFESLIEEGELYKKIMNLEETSFSEKERAQIFKGMVLNILLPWFDKTATIEGMRVLKNAGKLKNFGLRKELLDILS